MIKSVVCGSYLLVALPVSGASTLPDWHPVHQFHHGVGAHNGADSEPSNRAGKGGLLGGVQCTFADSSETGW